MIPSGTKIGAAPLIRPRLLIECARIGARHYRRARDLPGALSAARTDDIPGALVERLAEAERGCEEQRRSHSPAYRPGRHVQVLAALLAEAAGQARPPGGQAKASGSAALRAAI